MKIKMKIKIADTNYELSQQAADEILEFTSSIKEPLICTASGDSPSGLYKELVHRVNEKESDISSWKFVGLDEWAGMNGDDQGSCRYHLNNQFYHPLKISEERICFFDGRAKNPEEECRKTENFIKKNGNIDIAIIGLGLNGHIGMNEPGTSPTLRSHVADIDPQTQQVGQKYFTKPQQLSQGLTLGLATIMEAKKIILIVTGSHKAAIVKEILEENAPQLPASLLRNHPGLTIYLDKQAAQFIS